MKKLLLSMGVIIIFLAYSWHQKNEAGNAKVIIPIVPTNSPTTAQAPVSTTGSTPPPQPTAIPTAKPVGLYKNGEYIGSAADAFYGIIQIKAVISNGRLTDVIFLQYPNDRDTSIEINSQAMPVLKQEAIVAQNANVDIVSGATDSSAAFRQSLENALSQAKI